MKNYPTYPAYKDSGVEWLGEIPEGWEAIKMKYLFRDVSIKNKPEEELLSVTQDKGVVPRTWVESRMVMPSGNLESFKYIKKGDFAISLRSFEGGLEFCHHDGIISPAYTVLKKKNGLVDGYYRYLFKSFSFISEIQTSVVGIREGKNISYPELSYSLLPIPSPEEQTAIANFLDEKTTKIDRAIAQKEKMIALLKERKQIIIQQAVTGQLKMENGKWIKRPQHEMKDSGVEWIGQIPKGWEVKRLKYFVYIQSGLTLGKSYGKTKLVSIPYLRVANVQDGYFALNQIAEVEIPEGDVPRYLLRKGDILVTEGGDIDKLGRGTIWNSEIDPCIHQNHIFSVRVVSTDINTNFISLAFGADYGRKYFTHTANKTTNLASTNSTKLGNFPIAVPPLHEQKAIVAHIQTQSTKIDQAISLQQTQITKLKEYKATLIDSAVTGKIKVPGIE